MRDTKKLKELREGFTDFIELITSNDFKHHSIINHIIKRYINI